MPDRVLFSPQLQQQRRHSGQNRHGAVHLRVTTRAEREHEVQYGPSGYAMMHDDGTLVAPWSVAHAAAVLITL